MDDLLQRFAGFANTSFLRFERVSQRVVTTCAQLNAAAH